MNSRVHHTYSFQYHASVLVQVLSPWLGGYEAMPYHRVYHIEGVEGDSVSTYVRRYVSYRFCVQGTLI